MWGKGKDKSQKYKKEINEDLDKNNSKATKDKTKGKRKFYDINVVTLIIVSAVIIFIFNELLAIYNMTTFKSINDKTSVVVDEGFSKLNNIVDIAGYSNSVRGSLDTKISQYTKDNILSDMRKIKEASDELVKMNSYSSAEDNYIGSVKFTVSSLNSKVLKVLEGNDDSIYIDEYDISVIESDCVELSKNVNMLKDEVSAQVDKALDGLLEDNNTSANINIIFSQVIVIIIAIGYIVICLRVKGSLKGLSAALKEVSKGNLAVKLDCSRNDEFGVLEKQLKTTLDSVISLIEKFKGGTKKIDDDVMSLSAVSEEMAAVTLQVTDSIVQVSKDSEKQAIDIESSTELIREFSDTFVDVVKKVDEVSNTAENVSKAADVGDQELNKLVEAINDVHHEFDMVIVTIDKLEQSVKSINEITKLINNVTDQTNMLALNAAIEAARAGEAGKGFAVVADQIRMLAEKSKESLVEINNIVEDVSLETRNVTDNSEKLSNSFNNQNNTVEKSISSFKDIVQSINNILPLINSVSTAIYELEDRNKIIVEKSEDISVVAIRNQENAKQISLSSEEMSKSAKEVAETATSLTTVVSDTASYIDEFKTK